MGDDSTDNTAAFTACLNAIVAAGGGKMVLPDGVDQGRITVPPQVVREHTDADNIVVPATFTQKIVNRYYPTPRA